MEASEDQIGTRWREVGLAIGVIGGSGIPGPNPIGAPATLIDLLATEYPHSTEALASDSALDIETDLRFRW
jgi:hypothetical protein